jgi:virulence factor Mce-like protein
MRWRRPTEESRLPVALIGALVIAGTVLAFYLAATKDLPWSGGNEVEIQFSTASQISPDSPVRVAGVNVGDVKSIEEGGGGTATVTVEIGDEALPLHEDAQAKIRPRTFLEGSFFVDIKPGSPSAPEIGDGGTIPLGQTSVPVQFDQILSSLQAPTRARLREMLAGLGTGLDGGGPAALNATIPELDPLFTDGARVAEAFAGTEPHDLSGAIRETSKVTAALASDRPRLAALVSNFAAVARVLSERQAELAASVRGLDDLLAEAPGTLTSLESATPEARALLAELRPILRQAPSVINPAVPAAAQLERLLRRKQLPTLVSLAEPTVRELAAAAPTATAVFGGLRTPVNCLLTSAVPTLLSELDDGALSSGQPVYRELLYTLVGLSSASQSFDGNGFSTRYYAGFDNQVISTSLGNPASSLFALFGPDPILGSRPAKPAAPPPWQPQAPCNESAPPDLDAALGLPGFSSAGTAEAAPAPEPSRAWNRALAPEPGGGK